MPYNRHVVWYYVDMKYLKASLKLQVFLAGMELITVDSFNYQEVQILFIKLSIIFQNMLVMKSGWSK